jgi:hypothetical protein
MLKAGIYVSECTELEVDLISNVHQEGSHVAALDDKDTQK